LDVILQEGTAPRGTLGGKWRLLELITDRAIESNTTPAFSAPIVRADDVLGRSQGVATEIFLHIERCSLRDILTEPRNPKRHNALAAVLGLSDSCLGWKVS
jgi:hypothetical protein